MYVNKIEGRITSKNLDGFLFEQQSICLYAVKKETKI